MLAMTLVVCAGVGLIQVAVATAARHGLGPRPRLAPRTARRATLGALALAVVIAVAAGVPGELSQRWDDFKQPHPRQRVGRSAVRQRVGQRPLPMVAIGGGRECDRPADRHRPGHLPVLVARARIHPGPVLDAHSLYLQTLAEDGIVGLALLLALFGTVSSSAPAPRSQHRPERLRRGGRGRVRGIRGCGRDRLGLAARRPAHRVLRARLGAGGARIEPAPGPRLGNRTGAAMGRRSRRVDRRSGRHRAAAGRRRGGEPQPGRRQREQPRGGAGLGQQRPRHPALRGLAGLQQALVYELQGDYASAVAAAKQATRADATNWQTWVVLSRLQAEAGNADGSLSAYRRARALNPLSPLFAK